MTYCTHWDPWTDYDADGYEVPRRTHRDLEPMPVPRFGYHGPQPDRDDDYEGPDDPYMGYSEDTLDAMADMAEDREYGGAA